MPNRPPKDIRAEAEHCRKRAAECSDVETAEDWLALAAAFDKVALVAESNASSNAPQDKEAELDASVH